MTTNTPKVRLVPGMLALAFSLMAAVPSVFAQEAGQRVDESATTAAPTTTPRPFEELDQNADGAISKDEAAVDPPLAQVFGTLDKDADGRLSPEEYAVHTQGTP